jgi:alpha-N-arabinofuranosidase
MPADLGSPVMIDATIAIADEPIGTISPRLYGAFAEHLGCCCYGGLWVGLDSPDVAHVDGFRRDVVDALRELPTPLIRWPGGCYADHYHWRNGIGAPATRPGTLGLSCGIRSSDTNALGTHEFMRLCELVEAEAYVAGNVGSGTAQELCDWIEYVNSATDSALTRERAANGRPEPWGVRLWGIGNESWDCGGRFDPESYAREYRRFAAMARHVDPQAELVAVGLEDEPLPESHLDADWNARFLRALGPSVDLVDHLSIHKYWLHGGPETEFDEAAYYALLAEADSTEALIERTARTIASIVPASHRIGIALDEWGVWHPEARDWGPRDAPARTPVTLEQANTLRDALAAAVAFEGFHRQCNVLSMTNLAQVVNVLQAVLLTDGPSCVRTPTYHAIALHRPHVGAQALPARVKTDISIPTGTAAVSATASRRDAAGAGGRGRWAVTIVNRHVDRPVAVEVRGPDGALASALALTADRAAATNTPDQPEQVAPRPLEVSESDGGYRFTLPAHSMATLELIP